jgi:acyl carrier protein
VLEELKSLVRNIMPDKKIDYDKVTLESDLIKDLGFDSIAFIMVAIGIEQEFGVEVSQIDSSKFRTVGDVLTYIEQNKK